ncbi:MAG: hypothetical protein RLZZ299_413 [Pseudomonadota bacterium]|jgi:outer membrane protein OmpA-like peptidoglycan-associated protein
MNASVLLLLSGVARAGDIEIFAPDGDVHGYQHTQSASPMGHLQLGAGVWVNYADDPLVLVDAQGNRVAANGDDLGSANDGLIESRLDTHAQLGMGFRHVASLVLDVPFVLSQEGWNVSQLDRHGGASATSTTALGDIRLTPKVALVRAPKGGVAVALAVPMGLPTGSDKDFVGAGGFTAGPQLLVEMSDKSVVERKHRWRTAINLGYDVRPVSRLRDLQVGNGMSWAAAFGLAVARPLELTVEGHGRSAGSFQSSPAEALLGARVRIGESALLRLAGGTAIVGGIGAPDYRVVAGLTLAPNFDPAARDTDKDGFVDGNDRCPLDAEDGDAFEDEDGCPDRDNDADGREDGIDGCPNDPEDDDGYMDNDGCPDPDNDKDGVSDTADRCPDQAETPNGVDDDDGCPDDQVNLDSDGDGFTDTVDRCPYDPEDANGFEDEDGCPDERLRTARVVVTKGSIKINDVILFETGNATIQAASFGLVDEIAQVIAAHPEIKRIRVEGHTDDVGQDIANLKLSQARAESVMRYLVGKGIEAGRLDAAGFGEMRPLAPNDSDDNRAKNRRVEFIIVDRD